jgi:hypothetical protein
MEKQTETNQEENHVEDILQKTLLIIGTDSDELKKEFSEKYKESEEVDLMILDKNQLDLTIFTLSKQEDKKEQENKLTAFIEDEENQKRSIELAMKVADFSDKRNGGWFTIEKMVKYFKNMNRPAAVNIVANLKLFGLLIEDEKINGLFKIVCTEQQKIEYHSFMKNKRLEDIEKIKGLIEVHDNSIKKFMEIRDTKEQSTTESTV